MSVDSLTLPAGRFARFLAFFARSHVGAVFALLILCAAAFAPGFVTMPPMDRDEPRFAQASKQMLESRDFIDIRFQDEARHKKPVGIYWLQVASVSIGEALGVPEARVSIWLYRIPSLIGAIGAVLLTYWAALAFGDRRLALLAGAILVPTILIGVEARLAKTDAVLVMLIVLMQGALARIWLRRRHGGTGEPGGWVLPGLFWIGFALSILIKGPIGPMVTGLTILALVAFTRDWRWLGSLRWITGLILTAAIVAPWLVTIMIETKGSFLRDSLGQDMMAKVATGKESHGAPPGTYLAVFWGTFWPMAPIVALALPWLWRSRREAPVIFLLCWIVPTWIVFEAVATKLPHYVLPTYPAIAIATAVALMAGGLSRARWGRHLTLLIPIIALVLPVAGFGAIIYFEGTIPYLMLPMALLAAALGWSAWKALNARRDVDAVGLSGLAAITVFTAIYAIGMPALPTLWPSPRLAEAARSMSCPEPLYATAGYREPSLVFLVGTTLEMTDGAGAADFLAKGPCRMAFVDKRDEAAFQARATEIGLTPSLTTRVGGINLNGGRELDIGVYRGP